MRFSIGFFCISAGVLLLMIAMLTNEFTNQPKKFLPLTITNYHGISISGKDPVSINVEPK